MFTNDTRSLSPISNRVQTARGQNNPTYLRTDYTPPKTDRTYGNARLTNRQQLYNGNESPFNNNPLSARTNPTASIEFQIRHMEKKTKALNSTFSGHSRSPATGRNPILQHEEVEHVFKPSCKVFQGAGGPTMFKKEQIRRTTKPGECHPNLMEPKQEKPQGIKQVSIAASKSYLEAKKRELKAVQINRQAYNPIVEGDPASIKPINTRRIDQQVSQHYAKHSEKLYLLPSERKISPRKLNNGPSTTKCRLNMDDSSNILSTSTNSIDYVEKPRPLLEKHNGTIRDVIQYKNGPLAFKETMDMPEKVNNISAKKVKECLNTEKQYFRKKSPFQQKTS